MPVPTAAKFAVSLANLGELAFGLPLRFKSLAFGQLAEEPRGYDFGDFQQHIVARGRGGAELACS